MINIKLYSENRRILQIAIPSIISNITVPLLGLIDVTIVGHLGSPAYIGAIAVGGMLFNIIYWIFGFLRMGTSGMTSQAYGQHDLNEITRLLLRSVGVGLSIAICLLILQYPILKLAFTFIQTTPEVEQLATTYFYICIWGAPAMLGLYGFAGWFIGMQNSRFPMYIAITQNIVNITASLCLVYLLDMKVAGRSSYRNPYRPICRVHNGNITIYPLLQQTPQTNCLAGDMAETSYVPLLSGQPGYILPYTLLGYRHYVFHFSRSRTRRDRISRKHIAHAIIHSLFLYHGRFCLCR